MGKDRSPTSAVLLLGEFIKEPTDPLQAKAGCLVKDGEARFSTDSSVRTVGHACASVALRYLWLSMG